MNMPTNSPDLICCAGKGQAVNNFEFAGRLSLEWSTAKHFCKLDWAFVVPPSDNYTSHFE
jgi:hypothetical protein